MITLIKRFILIGLLGALLAACSPAVTPGPIHQLNNPYAPQAGDESLIRDNVQIVKTEIGKFAASVLVEDILFQTHNLPPVPRCRQPARCEQTDKYRSLFVNEKKPSLHFDGDP
jgi:hypothetical protein